MKILIADDEKDIADAIGIILNHSDYETEIVYNGIDAYEKITDNVYDGVILDIMMPGMSGTEVLKKVREEGDVTPILLLTAKTQVEDKIKGLNMGADDYLAKPFNMGELIARVNVMVRRNNVYDTKEVKMGNIVLNTEKLRISNGETSLRLANRESEILEYMIKNKDKKIEETKLKEKFWEKGDYEEGAVNLYIHYLKNKLNSMKANIDITIFDDNRYALCEK